MQNGLANCHPNSDGYLVECVRLIEVNTWLSLGLDCLCCTFILLSPRTILSGNKIYLKPNAYIYSVCFLPLHHLNTSPLIPPTNMQDECKCWHRKSTSRQAFMRNVNLFPRYISEQTWKIYILMSWWRQSYISLMSVESFGTYILALTYVTLKAFGLCNTKTRCFTLPLEHLYPKVSGCSYFCCILICIQIHLH